MSATARLYNGMKVSQRLATNLHRLRVSDKVIQQIRRHANVTTTMNIYRNGWTSAPSPTYILYDLRSVFASRLTQAGVSPVFCCPDDGPQWARRPANVCPGD